MKRTLSKLIGSKQFYITAITIALPIMAQSFVTSFVNLIDNVMISSQGATALTAVTVANKYYMILNAALMGIGGSGSIFISQFFGADNKKNCQKIFNMVLSFALIIGAIFMFAISFFSHEILSLFTQTDSIISSATQYINYIKFSYIPFALSFVIMTSLRAVGINNIQLKVGITTVLTNTLLNYTLIYGNFGLPAMGVEGAAIATLIARVLEMAVYFIILVRSRHFFKLEITSIFKYDFALFKTLTVKALPLITNEVFYSIGYTVIFASYMKINETLIAGISAADTVINIAYIIFGGLSSAVAILIGKKLGAGEIKEAKENATKLTAFGAMVGIGMGLILFLIAPLIPNIFNLGEEVNQTIVEIIRIKSVLIWVFVINVCVFFTLRAGGDMLSTLILDCGVLWGMTVVAALLLSNFTTLPLTTVYFIVEAIEIIKLILAIYFFRRGRWAKNLTLSH